MEVNKKQLADIFGASIRTIQNWQEQGMPVLRGGGKGNEVLYDSAAVIKWYAKRDAEIENEKLRREVEELRQASEADLQPGTIIDMPAGQGTLTLTFTVSSSGANNWTPTTSISDLLVVVMKKSTAGISIS
nr:terminase small subunit [Escherichia coli]